MILWWVPAKPGPAGSDDSASRNWGNPVRVEIVGENHEVQTTFLVGLKDAWWTDYGCSGDKKTFFVVYYYKNLGPREGSFSLGPNGPFSDKKVEIKTDKGHIFSGHDFSVGLLFGLGSGTRDVGGWQPREIRKIDETGESALIFEVPRNEAPTELMTTGSIDLNVGLPQGDFGFRRYNAAFGFLPQKVEKAVPGLIGALQDKDGRVRMAAMEVLGTLGPAAKDAVPAITGVLLHDVGMDIRAAAAKTLGEIGPAAKEAIPRASAHSA